MLTLDHIFIITQPGAELADKLIALGMVEGSSNTHPGQGTANRRFFFDGFVLEFVYVSDAHEAATGAGQRLEVLQRSRNKDASPFGLVARLADGSTEPAFDHWLYYPDYFGEDMCFFVGDNSTQWQEPLCICMPSALPMRSAVPANYANVEWGLTTVEITVPDSGVSPVLEHFSGMEMVDVKAGGGHHLALEFNNRAAGSSADLRPQLPLMLYW